MENRQITRLKGMTWDHIRGYAPLVAVSERFQSLYPGFEISWDRRSLKDFGDYPVDLLAREYDIILIDHPHVGISSAQGVLEPLDRHVPSDFLQEQEAHSVGLSHRSYQWNGHQWALAVDAAAQVASFRPDLLDGRALPQTWTQLIDFARSLPDGIKIGWPLCPTDAMCSFLTLCAGIDGSDFFEERQGIRPEVGEEALRLMLELLPLLHKSSLDSNPIQMYNFMSSSDEIVYVPLAFGYTNYSRSGFCKHLIRFTNIPTPSGEPRGSLLGGVGIAVSVFSRHTRLALEFAQFAASEDVQRTTYVENGGQPGHLSAWQDEEANLTCSRFFLDTLQTLKLSYMRPRHSAFPAFQEEAGQLLHTALLSIGSDTEISPKETIAVMNRLYQKIRGSLSDKQVKIVE